MRLAFLDGNVRADFIFFMNFVTAVFILSFGASIVVDIIDCSLIAGNEVSVYILFAFVMIASSVALMIFNGLRLCCMASLVLVRFVEGIDCVIVGLIYNL